MLAAKTSGHAPNSQITPDRKQSILASGWSLGKAIEPVLRLQHTIPYHTIPLAVACIIPPGIPNYNCCPLWSCRLQDFRPQSHLLLPKIIYIPLIPFPFLLPRSCELSTRSESSPLALLASLAQLFSNSFSITSIKDLSPPWSIHSRSLLSFLPEWYARRCSASCGSR